MENTLDAKTKYTRIIVLISVIIPVAVAVLIFMPLQLNVFGSWVKLLPTVNAVINSLTAVFLIMAVVMIKKKNIDMHRKMMSAAFILGAIFLVSYIIYHASVPSTVYGDINGDGVLSEMEQSALGSSRSVYLFVLLSHIFLSIVVVPFVLMAFYYALSGKIDQHKRIVKFTFPIWLYVSVTGVITYLLISPYYQ